MKDLADLKELKSSKQADLKLASQDVLFEEEKIGREIDKLRKEKDYLIGKQQVSQKEYEHKRKKQEQLFDDISKYD